MESVLHGFDVNGATWFYLSLLLIVAVFFRFGRVWSLRNLDLALMLCLSPGLLFVREQKAAGYIWLFAVSGLLLVRLCFDSFFERRPRIDPNLNPPGLAFLGASTFAFLMTIVVTNPPTPQTVETVRRAEFLLYLRDASDQSPPAEGGPASSLLAASVAPISNVVVRREAAGGSVAVVEVVTARILVILAHMAVIAGLFCVGRRHFNDANAGLAMGALYLMLPCTAYDIGRVNHVLPAALIVWALVAYRKPMIAGGLLGLSAGTMFFAAFLLPLWAIFYGRRGALKFALSLGVVSAVLLGSLALTSADTNSFKLQTFGWIDWPNLGFRDVEPPGFWSFYDSAYRIPVFAAFAVMLVFLTIWPRKKTLEDLAAHSTAIIVGIQFWYPQQGGVYMLWYLPLLLVVAFRPRLAHLGPPTTTATTAEPATADSTPREPAPSGVMARSIYR